ncbi:TniQ family protein [Streptomyces sp. ITFR-16]|uniref:TniQ family protein n=1 Tax=Streptomyces sp. ITFR-16 TaxID=3075198 RepID=UPI002889B624|nr:TniQ family protein [Streptomyces sp. ITFR-16]WNI24931.1 TniQ family protein [Streptomyces sp. ITFR-16]
MTQLRTLPIRLAPHPGEALDSWWEAVAHRLGTTTGDVLTSMGLLPRGPSRPVESGTLGRLVTLLDADQVAGVAWSAGPTREQVHAMTLARYDGRAHRIDARRRRVEARHVWGRARGSRYCPACLAESGGRWQLSWRLGWSFACLDHHLLLVDACPRCSRTPRHFPATTRHPLAPGRCHSPSENELPARCGQPFEEVPALMLAAPGSTIAAQERIETAISSGRAGFSVYQDHPQSSLALFADLRALVSILLRRVPQRLTGFAPPEIVALHQLPLPEKRRSFDPVEETRPGRLAPRRAATAALTVSAALHILGQSDAHQAATVLRDLISDADGNIPLKVGLRWAHTSPVFDAIHLATLAPRLKLTDQLRYRTPDPMPRRPGPSAATRIAERARKTPTQLWPAWSARLSPQNGALSRTIRPALSCYLLLIGGTRNFSTGARLLRAPVEDRLGTHMTSRLAKQGHFKAIGLGLSALADYLDQEESPIDYDRRRAADYRDLLPLDTWTQLCRDIGFEAGGVRRHQFARALLFERLSGLPAPLAPTPYAPSTAELRTMLRTFETDLTPALMVQLEGHAAEFLIRQKIHGEPVSWQPPTDSIRDLELPGCDLRDIDLGMLHRLIRDDCLTTAQAARRLNVSHDTVRFVLQEQPAPPGEAKSAKWERGATVRRARAALPRDKFARFYLDEYRSLKWIAEHADVNVDAIKVLVREYGMKREGKATRWRQIDLDWLRDQRATGRTCRDLAAETGFSLGMISYLARRHDLPGRRPRAN